jgi:hypothetical protein
MKIDVKVMHFDRPAEHYKLVDDKGNTVAICWSLSYAHVIKEALEAQ